MLRTRGALICAVLALGSRPASGDVTVLLCEPYGQLNRFSPMGHISIYLDRVCADSPTQVRRCQPGELGVVISRYKGVGGADWLAVPLIPYLYAVERAEDVPEKVDREQVAFLRNAYREAHLRALVPDDPSGQPPRGNWYQLVGAVYDRRVIAFTARTTAAADDSLIELLNGKPNRSRFSTLFHNCADFASDVINHYFPKAVRNSFVADLGLTTPKHVAKSFLKYAKKRPELEQSAFVIPQIMGNRPPSGGTRGVMEALVKKAIYVVPLAVVEPWIPVAIGSGYLVAGRFNPQRNASGEYGPRDVEAWTQARVATPPPDDTVGSVGRPRDQRDEERSTSGPGSFRGPEPR